MAKEINGIRIPDFETFIDFVLMTKYKSKYRAKFLTDLKQPFCILFSSKRNMCNSRCCILCFKMIHCNM